MAHNPTIMTISCDYIFMTQIYVFRYWQIRHYDALQCLVRVCKILLYTHFTIISPTYHISNTMILVLPTARLQALLWCSYQNNGWFGSWVWGLSHFMTHNSGLVYITCTVLQIPKTMCIYRALGTIDIWNTCILMVMISFHDVIIFTVAESTQRYVARWTGAHKKMARTPCWFERPSPDT